MGAKEDELKVLMSEKDQADKQIGSYLELQLKLFAFLFSAAAVAGSWSLTSTDFANLPGKVKAACALTLAFIGCFAVLQSVVNYGIVLGYIRYKHLVIGERIKAVAGLEENPLKAFSTIAAAKSNYIVVIASVLIGTLVLAFNGALLAYAVNLAGKSAMLWSATVLCIVMLAGAGVCGLGLIREIAVLKREVGA